VEVVGRELGGVPWSINFAPNGRLFFTNRDLNQIRVSELNLTTGTVTHFNGTSAVRDEGEGGILGMELDPNFATNNQLYICYSISTSNGPRNRLSRFQISGTFLTNEQVLLDNMLGAFNHNGCRVVWGPDEKLYVSMGDAAYPPNSQDLSALAGKIFRINPDGSIPTDNPFLNQTTGSARAIWALGLRNSQGLAFQPATGLLWSTEHGENTRDELNVLRAGRNYGWPLCAGVQRYGERFYSPSDRRDYRCIGQNLTAQNYRPAVREYSGGEAATIAPSDMIFYTGDAFPAMRGNLLFVTLRTGRLYRLVLNGESVAHEEILIDNSAGPHPGFGRLRDITTGPDGFIYVSTDAGRILRLVPAN
jgi:glucose/arabinose dehydrogenase